MLRSAVAIATLAMGACLGPGSAALAQGLVPCAQENGFCQVPFPTQVIYGVPGRTVSRPAGPPGILCSNAVFGDPARGVTKACAYVARAGGGGGGGGFDRPGRGRGAGFDEPRGGRGGAGECRELRQACLMKDQLGERGEGNCRRYRQLCGRD